MLTTRASGSFRDPEGCVFVVSNRVFRGVAATSADCLREFLQSDFFKDRAGQQIVNTWEVCPAQVLDAGIPKSDVDLWYMWVEHEMLPLITYPYEWSFDTLKHAACFTLNLLADALRDNYTLKDASAFNVQFVQNRPIFIDVLSFVVYEEGTPFVGYKQFCEQFFAPLCLTALAGIEFNQWFRGRLDGLDLIEVSKALPFSTSIKSQVLLHIHLQAWAMQRNSSSNCTNTGTNSRRIQKRSLIALTDSLSRFIGKLERRRRTFWKNYAVKNTYDECSRSEKMAITQEFVARIKPKRLLDLGCNTGEYSKIANDAGECHVIGLDSDCGAIDSAAKQARLHSWSADFLYWDVVNPSPNIGWENKERTSLNSRLGKVEAVLCFALIHHIVIGRNIPLEEFIVWVCQLAPRGLIEFVPKSDPMVQNMLRHREDVFSLYNDDEFKRILLNHSAKVTMRELQPSSRTIYEFERN